MTGDPVLEGGDLRPAALGGPVPAGVSALALDRIAAVRAARLRLDHPEDNEALHDFRVAIRRLRTLLRAFRPATPGAVPVRLRRGLRQIARDTSASRDLEVKLLWLAARAPELRPRDRVAVRWLRRRLLAAKQDADARARARINRRLEALLAGLERRMQDLATAASPNALVLALVMSARLRDLVDRFRDRLGRVTSIANQDAAHDVRIAGKRVRYLLEPLATLPEGASLVDRFKRLQDVLGEMHDADVLAGAVAAAMEKAATERGRRVAALVREGETLDRAALRRERRRDPMPGLLALAALAQTRRERAWTEFERDWLGQAEELLLAPATQLAVALEASSPRPLVEIERKYLLRELPPKARQTAPVEIEQGYVPGERIQERVRRVRGRDSTQWYRTLKEGVGMVRSEIEEETGAAVFEALWPLTRGRRVRKRRYAVEDNGLVWEIDEFTDRNLILAEVELTRSDQAVEPPEWLAPYVVREVTEEAEYLNVNLAK